LTVIFEVFRQERRKDYHVHVGDVHAPNREMATTFAQVLHARRKPANSLWVVPKAEISEVDADDEGVAMGGTTRKNYRWATNYDTDETFAREIEDSQREQEAASANGETADADRTDGGESP
jgi:ring-1,2-phenylacetyl-CoA epoxidase subunit PaaB